MHDVLRCVLLPLDCNRVVLGRDGGKQKTKQLLVAEIKMVVGFIICLIYYGESHSSNN